MFKRILPRNISDYIVEQFKGMLSSGELKPGDELPSERTLAKLIGVSRYPLREALNTLKTLGFIEIKPRSKMIIKSFAGKSIEEPLTYLLEHSIDKVFELLEIRRAMEGWAAYKAAENASKKDVERLRTIIYQEKEDLKSDKYDPKKGVDFHLSISVATHNTLLIHLTNFCYNLLWSTRKMAREKTFDNKTKKQLLVEQHTKIFEAVKNRDGKRASKESRSHVDFIIKELRKVFLKEKNR